MQAVQIYIETSVKPPRKGALWYGYVLEYLINGQPYTKSDFGYFSEETPNRAALQAVMEGVKRLKRPCHVTIHTNNSYVLTGIRDRMEWWKKEDWKNARGQEIKHADLWQKLYYELSIHETETGSSPAYESWMMAEMKRRECERINVSKRKEKKEEKETQPQHSAEL